MGRRFRIKRNYRKTGYLYWRKKRQLKNKQDFHQRQANYYRSLLLKLRR